MCETESFENFRRYFGVSRNYSTSLGYFFNTYKKSSSNSKKISRLLSTE